MRYKQIIQRVAILAAIFLSGVVGATAQSLEQARTLAEDGNVDDAIAMLRAVVENNPNDIESALLLGDLLWDTGHDADALKHFEALSKCGERDATLRLARLECLRYEIEKSRSLLEAYRKTLKKGKRKIAEDNSGDLDEQIDRIASMLDRVQNIEVIDSVEVDAEEFFRKYPISPAAGRLLGAEALPDGFPVEGLTMVHKTESGNRMVWSAFDADGNSCLYGSSALLGNEWETPEPLGDELREGGDAVYPFLMPDGITLYYSNDGENSLGGYDIYLTRMGDGGFLQPANVGLPFNSPYNDYLLVIDEYTGAGWFASDRNRHPGKITIYTFIPQDLRVNVAIDNPNIASLARLDNIALTRKAEMDYSEIIAAIEEGQSMSDSGDNTVDFLFALPGNKVYTTISDFRNQEARAAMKAYLVKERRFAAIESRLEDARQAYGRGDQTQAAVILRIEDEIDDARNDLREMRDQVIELEMQ